MDRLDLSPAAQKVLYDGLRRNLTSRPIAHLIRRQTGQVVSDRTVRRRIAELLRQQERRAEIREHIQAFAEAMKAADWFPPEIILALVFGLVVVSPESLIRPALDPRGGGRPARAAVPESEWDRHVWQVVRKLRSKMNRGEDLNVADADELGAICKLQGTKNEGGHGNE
jgi:hypothetical protein